MSYGTILFPNLDDFPLKDTPENLEKAIDSEIAYMENQFGVFRALSVCTPKDVIEHDAMDTISLRVEEAFEKYIKSYNTMCDIRNTLDLHEQASNIEEGETFDDGTPKRPMLYYNHFVYHSQSEASELVNENTTELYKLRARILGICLATPSDITPRNDENYSDGHYEPLYYLEKEMDYLQEALDECLRAIRVARLTAKYWDGHEEG